MKDKVCLIALLLGLLFFLCTMNRAKTCYSYL